MQSDNVREHCLYSARDRRAKILGQFGRVQIVGAPKWWQSKQKRKNKVLDYNESETMATRDAFICYRVLSRIQQVAREHPDFKVGLQMFQLVGRLQFLMFGFASCSKGGELWNAFMHYSRKRHYRTAAINTRGWSNMDSFRAPTQKRPRFAFTKIDC